MSVTVPHSCVAAGMRIMRLNFSHATVEEVELRLTNLAQCEGVTASITGTKTHSRSILLDTKGPEIRMGGLAVCQSATGAVPSENRKAKILLEAGDEVTLVDDPAVDGHGDASKIFVSYDLPKILAPGNKVLLDDGLIMMDVKEVTDTGVVCVVQNTNEIGERKGVNLPGVVTGLPAMSDKDRVDIKYGIEKDIDFVAASFVNNKEGVEEIRGYIAKCMDEVRPGELPPLIISKIESTEAMENFDDILEASDGIMVARGDLGVEIPMEEVVLAQKMMVEKCNAAGKPVIVATQMLDTMQSNPRPTRAEVADVTNAVCDGADAVMLSGESANGKFPVESIGTMRSIINSTELCPEFHVSNGVDLTATPTNPYEATAAAAVTCANHGNASAIVVVESETGETARLIAKYRPDVPVVVVCTHDQYASKVARQLTIVRGCHPIVMPGGVEFATALDVAKKMGCCEAGDEVVVLSSEEGAPHGLSAPVPALRCAIVE